MSADNVHIVTNVYHRPYQYGIFHVMGDGPESTEWFTIDRAIQVYNYPVAAIVAAHFIELKNPTEYGVSVDESVLSDVPYDDRKETPIGWSRIK